MRTFAARVFLLFLSSALVAQQSGPQPLGRAVQDGSLSANPLASPGQTPLASQTQKRKQPPAKPPAKHLKRTEIEGSMVGYIEPAAVQTAMRVRFDAGFDAPRPDRAEYFYAGTSAPGGGGTQRTLNFQQLYLYGEYAPLKRVSASFQLPFRWIQPTFVPGTVPAATVPTPPTGGGIGDVQAALKFAAIASPARALTLQLRGYFPSGNGTNGLGTNHFSIEPKLLFYQKLSSRAALEAEAGDTHPIGGTQYRATPSSSPRNFAADVAMYGLGPSYRLIQRDRYSIAPVFELAAWHVFGGLQTGSTNVVQSAGGINVLNAKLGARASFSNGSSIYAGYGRSLTSDIWYRNLFRIEYRQVF